MVVQYDANDSVTGVVLIKSAQQCDELDAAMAQFHVGQDFSSVQVQRGQDGDSAVAHVLMIASDAGMLAGHWRQICSRGTQGLHARLFIHADGVHRHWPRVVRSVSAVQIDVPIDHQHLGHLALELRVSALQVVAHPMRLEVVRIEDAPHRCLARLSQASKPSLHGATCSASADSVHSSAANPKSLGLRHARSTTQALAASVICGA